MPRFRVGDVVKCKDGCNHEITHIDVDSTVYLTHDFCQFPINEFDSYGILVGHKNEFTSIIKCECGGDKTYGVESTSEFHSRWMNCPKSF